MASSHPNDDSYYSAVPLAAEHSAAIIETVDELVQIKIVGPIVTTTVLLNRTETRDVALHMIDATQIDRAEED